MATAPLPPGRTGLPLLGETLAFLFDRRFFAARKAEFGPLFRSRLFGRDVVISASPEANLAIFRGEHRYFESTWPNSTQALLGADTLALQKGDTHRQRRRLLAHAFRPRALAGYAPRMDATIGEYIAAWQKGQPIVWARELRHLSFDIAMSLFTGTRAGENSPLLHDFETYAGGLFTFAWAIPGTRFHAARRARARLVAHVDAVIAARRGAARDGADTDVLDLLLAARDEDGTALAHGEIAEQILLLLFAGHETLTSALTSFCLLLSQHPAVLARARAEVDARVPAGPLGELELDLPYTERVLCEVMRRLPPVGGGFRKCIADCEIAGYTIPAGTYVLYGITNTHLDATIHPEPDAFDPDRFADPGDVCPAHKVPTQGHDGRFIPFGGGARICLGMEFARQELRLFAARLLRDCTWQVEPDQDLRLRMVPVPKPRSGLRVRVAPRA